MPRLPAKSPSRRQLVLGSLGGLTLAAAATAPAWLRSAFADTTSCPPPKGRPPAPPGSAALVAQYSQPPHSNAAFRAAFDAAKRRGKPLLVFVIPTDTTQCWERGSAFGAYLNHATPEQLAPLALLDVVCATHSEIVAQVPTAPAGQPLMMLIDTDGSHTATPLDHALAVAAKASYGDEYSQRIKTMDAAIEAQITDISTLLRVATFGNDASLARWEAQAASVVPAAEAQSLKADFAAHKEIDAARLGRGAIFLARATSHAASASGAADLARARNLLGAAAGSRLTTRVVDGSFWATGAGCGVNVEGDPTRSAIGCGMGMVPTKAQRFLYFFAPHSPTRP